MRLLTDEDVLRFPRAQAILVMREAVLAAERGTLEAPARVHTGGLTFTAGGNARVFGFRAYPTRETPLEEQLVAVWNAAGRVEAIVLGGALGPLRTAALGALATEVLAPPDAGRLGLIGSGVQAEAHALSVAAVRPLEQVLVYSPSAENRQRLVGVLRAQGLPAEGAESAREVCVRSNLLTLATNSSVSVIETAWVQPGTHVCTLGPKEQERHECPLGLASAASLVVTDGLAQLGAYTGGHIFAGVEVLSLGSCLEHPPERSPEAITLFLSVGLAGTEVLLAEAMVEADLS